MVRARSVERRAEILRATLEVIAERGYRGATLGAVAERVGLSQQGLLHYFPTKEAMLVAVLEERDQWDTGGGPRSDGGWRTELLGSLVEYNAMRPGVVQTFSALLGESVTEEHPAREFFTHRYTQVRASMTAMLRAEFGERLPGGLTPERAAPLLVATMDGLQYQWLLDPDAVDMPAAFQDFLRLLRPDTAQGAGPETTDASGTDREPPPNDLSRMP
ncbi:TetR/AcrR family transcriptional regulator [Streptomyces sp. NPDC059818]|uniref:TetR/AcrR family transcriptional regulator n=1 Tax=Streptomyces sp. NPDC059818 TaxID=3346962 RepID=UPI00364CFB8A